MSDLSLPAVVTTLRSAGCVYAEEEAALLMSAADSPAELSAMIDRRVWGEPLEYVVGWAEFCGLRILVDPSVFVPRRRSEFLVQVASESLSPGSVVVDLCCGSGAIGAALVSSAEDIALYAADVNPAAVACARRNLAGSGEVFEGDLYEALQPGLRGRVDLLAVNAPYVPSDEVRLMPAEARLHEALVTLDGGADGLTIHRRVAAEAAQWLSAGGSLLIETSEHQAPLTAEAVRSGGLDAEILRNEDLDATVVIGRLR